MDGISSIYIPQIVIWKQEIGYKSRSWPCLAFGVGWWGVVIGTVWQPLVFGFWQVYSRVYIYTLHRIMQLADAVFPTVGREFWYYSDCCEYQNVIKNLDCFIFSSENFLLIFIVLCILCRSNNKYYFLPVFIFL